MMKNDIAPLLADLIWPYLEQKFSLSVNGVKVKQSEETTHPSNWITKKEAMGLLNVKPTTLYNLCKKGMIKFSHPSPRVKLYNRESISKHIEAQSL